jgi:hypothetical protein
VRLNFALFYPNILLIFRKREGLSRALRQGRLSRDKIEEISNKRSSKSSRRKEEEEEEDNKRRDKGGKVIIFPICATAVVTPVK